MTGKRNELLAINGGEPVRRERMPPRLAIGEDEVRMIQEVIAYYRELQIDPGYQGVFEKALYRRLRRHDGRRLR